MKVEFKKNANGSLEELTIMVAKGANKDHAWITVGASTTSGDSFVMTCDQRITLHFGGVNNIRTLLSELNRLNESGALP